MTYVLDACALIAYLNEEPEGKTVKELFSKALTGDISIYMSIVNLLEVYYGYIHEKRSVAGADVIMQNVYKLPIHIIDTITKTVYREAACLKAFYSISLADSFACATAKSLPAVLVTKDHEIELVEKQEVISVFWIK